jgi:hypothetical protein
MMWTRKGGLIIFLGIICLLLGLIMADFQFMVLAILIFTFFLLVSTMPRPEIEVEREVSNPLLFENGNLKVDLRLKKVREGYGTMEVFDRITSYSELKHGINNMVYNFSDAESAPLRFGSLIILICCMTSKRQKKNRWCQYFHIRRG